MVLDPDAFRLLLRARDLLADTPLPLSDIAREAGVSHFHFIRKFESVFGCTPHQFRIDQRIHRAKRLLASGRLSVTETCFEVGMSSLGSFSHLFLVRTGHTPSEFQRRARTLVTVPGTYPVLLFPGCLALMAHLPPGTFAATRC